MTPLHSPLRAPFQREQRLQLRELRQILWPCRHTLGDNDRAQTRLRFFSTITTFGTPRDVTVDELRIECAFPADEVTADVCRREPSADG